MKYAALFLVYVVMVAGVVLDYADGAERRRTVSAGTISTADLANNSVTDAKVVDTITASLYLPLTGGTLSDNLTAQKSVSVTQELTCSSCTASGAMRAATFIAVPAAVVIPDDDTGAQAAAFTLSVSSSAVSLTCNDPDGCTVTLGEGLATSGQVLNVVNVSTGAATFADSSGVSETAGAFAAGQWDSITYRYVADRWVETARSNN